MALLPRVLGRTARTLIAGVHLREHGRTSDAAQADSPASESYRAPSHVNRTRSGSDHSTSLEQISDEEELRGDIKNDELRGI
jgi:hypothetical protein